MICVTRPSDCSTSVGIVRADEPTGIWATVVAAEATSAISKATQAFRRGKLVEFKSYSSICAVSNGSSMTWTVGLAEEPKSHWRLPHGFLGCQTNPTVETNSQTVNFSTKQRAFGCKTLNHGCHDLM